MEGIKNIRILVLIGCLLFNLTAFSAKSCGNNLTNSKKVYYISLDGKNKNDGSINSPWRTLDHAFTIVNGGETILFREGTYRISLLLKRFKTKNGIPIRIEAYPNEKVVFDGTRTLKANWKLWKKGIYRTSVRQPFWQLFVDNKLADMARWPNTSFENDSIWRMTQSMRSIDGGFRKGKYTGKSRFGLVYDKDFKNDKDSGFFEGDSHYGNIASLESLSESNIDFTGTYAVLNIGNWLTWTRKIVEHKAGQAFFRYDTSGMSEQLLKNYGAYYIYGLSALDKVNEWWYDKKSKYLYYKPATKEELDTIEFQLRDQDFALKFINSQDISIRGIQFFATGFFSKESDRIGFEDCRFDYMSANKLVLGITNWFTEFNKDGENYNYATSFFKGKDCKFNNCVVSKSNAPISFMGEQMTIDNCMFEDIEWDLNSNGASGSIVLGANSKITRCVLKRAGNSEGIRPRGSGCTVRLNRIFDVGNLQHDGSGINVGTKDQINALVEFNWVHDSNRQGVRFDYHGSGIHNKNGAVYGDGIVRNNVTWNTQPNQIKGDRHLILNNTVINIYQNKNPFKEKFNMTIQGFKAMHEIESNAHSITRNNLAKLSHRSWNLELRGKNKEFRVRKDGYVQPKAQVLPGVNDHNTDVPGAAYIYLRDPKNLDFRPRKDSPIVEGGVTVTQEQVPSKQYKYTPIPFEGKAPDIGAYEYGANHYWIPGRQLEVASTPIPQNNSIVKADADLMFLEAKNAVKHIVYFGTSKNKLKKVATLVDSNIYTPRKLETEKIYFWRVDAVVFDSVIKGNVWSFTVDK